MKVQLLKLLWVVRGLTWSLIFVAVGSAHAQAIVSTEAADGTVELSNLSPTDSPEQAVPEPSAEAHATTTTAEPATTAEAPKDPREQYRDTVMKEPEGQPLSATSAVSRRYKKMDKAAYQASMLDTAGQTAPAPQAGGKDAN